MADRVILHIGPRKTGTTYLQTTLWENRDRLAEQGFFLPLESMAEQFEAVSRGRQGWWSNGRHDELWKQLVRQVRKQPGVAVVSTEMFAGLADADLAAVLADLRKVPVEVVLGVRALHRSIPAEWQQWVRARSEVSYAAWLAALREDRAHPFWATQDSALTIRRWTAVGLPADRVRAVVVPSGGGDPGALWHRFCAATGLEPAGFTLPAGAANESLGLVQAELLRRVNERLDPALTARGYALNVRRNLTGKVLLGAPGARKPVLPPEDRGWVAERAAELRDALVASGVAVHGDLADLDVPPASPDDDPMTVSEPELLEEALRTILGLLDRTAQRDREVRILRRGKDTEPDLVRRPS